MEAIMSKFYIQSGNFRTTITADDAEKASLWAIHKVMEQVLPLQSCDQDEPYRKSASCAEDGLMVLGEIMLVSELGFDDPDALELDTLELQMHWHQLATALARLEEMVISENSQGFRKDRYHPRDQDRALCELVG
jgi:hypothetical protein